MRLGVWPEATVATSGAGSSAGFQPSARPQQQQPVERRSLTMSLGQMDPALVCSGPMSNLSYDSHIVTRCIARLYRKFFLCNRKTFLLWQATDGGRAASTAAGHGPGQLHGPADGPRDTESGSRALQSLLRSEYRIQRGEKCFL